jgi:hypothetical protein
LSNKISNLVYGSARELCCTVRELFRRAFFKKYNRHDGRAISHAVNEFKQKKTAKDFVLEFLRWDGYKTFTAPMPQPRKDRRHMKRPPKPIFA